MAVCVPDKGYGVCTNRAAISPPMPGLLRTVSSQLVDGLDGAAGGGGAHRQARVCQRQALQHRRLRAREAVQRIRAQLRARNIPLCESGSLMCNPGQCFRAGLPLTQRMALEPQHMTSMHRWFSDCAVAQGHLQRLLPAVQHRPACRVRGLLQQRFRRGARLPSEHHRRRFQVASFGRSSPSTTATLAWCEAHTAEGRPG
jgi:hypothetical protein